MHDLYRHSIAVIRASQAPSGAYIASPTFPTYHYCWFRDSTYIAYAMDGVGEHESAYRFYDWATRIIGHRQAQIARVLAAPPGAPPPAADLLHTRYTLDGRDGGDDWPNFQLDGFGTLLWGIEQHVRLADRPLPTHWQEAVTLLAGYLGALWPLPCYDCWEEFSEHVHTATLAALYGGLMAASRLLGGAGAQAGQDAAAIQQFVLARCVYDGHLGKFVGNSAVDGSLVHVATPYRLLEPTDPLMQATVARIEATLRIAGGGVHRYAADTYYGGGEWVLLTAYLGWLYVEQGTPERAHALRAWIEGCADAADQLPEQVTAHLNDPVMLPVWESRWGTSACPLLWSHAAYLTLVTQLDGRPAQEDARRASAGE